MRTGQLPRTYSVGELSKRDFVTAFQSDSGYPVASITRLAVRGPERFRGGCAFGVIAVCAATTLPQGSVITLI